MESISEFFSEYKSIIIILHAMSAAIGLGAATVSDVLFFKFLKDGDITKEETPILDTMTNIMWVALSLLIATGIALFLSDPATYSESSKFIVKMFVVGAITLNGLVLTKYLHRNMHNLTFTNPYHKKAKRIAFASGAISIGSWYLSFILGSIRSIPLTIQSGILTYLLLLVIAVIVSQVMYARFQKKFLIKK